MYRCAKDPTKVVGGSKVRASQEIGDANIVSLRGMEANVKKLLGVELWWRTNVIAISCQILRLNCLILKKF